MRHGLLLLLIALCAATASQAAPERHDDPVPKVKLATAAGSDSIGQYGYKTTGNNLLNVTFTNSGGWGVGYTSSVVPNFTYPTGSSLEHMVRGGLWIGATAPCLSCSTGTQPVVSFAAQDENGAVSTPLTEFTPLPNDVNTRLLERSILKNNPHYNPAAISEDDFIAQFRDVPGQQVDQEAHVPLMVQVTESIYSWSFTFAESFIIQHFVIKNVSSSDLLQNVYVTHYTEMQTLNKASYSGYPSLTGGPSPYRHKLIHYFPDERLITEQYCFGLDGCHYDRAPFTVGVMMLGTHPDTIVNYNPHVLTRDYGGAALDAGTPYARDNDEHKYNFQHLSQGRGEVDSLQVPGSSDPSQWLTVGPIPILGPGTASPSTTPSWAAQTPPTSRPTRPRPSWPSTSITICPGLRTLPGCTPGRRSRESSCCGRAPPTPRSTRPARRARSMTSKATRSIWAPACRR